MVEERYQRIWRDYATLKRQCQIMRAGYARLGIYPGTADGKVEPLRSESVAEHTYGTLILLDEIAMFCPELVSDVELVRGMRLLLRHEVGEGEIGDLPDDGRRDEARKDKMELLAMMRFCQELPREHGPAIVRDFTKFQQRSSELAQVIYCVDKIEAVLQGLIYEQDGRGDLSRKPEVAESLSEQDKYYMQQTGSKRLVDNWSAHFFDLTREFRYAPVFRAILRAAVEDVRGEWFAWAED